MSNNINSTWHWKLMNTLHLRSHPLKYWGITRQNDGACCEELVHHSGELAILLELVASGYWQKLDLRWQVTVSSTFQSRISDQKLVHAYVITLHRFKYSFSVLVLIVIFNRLNKTIIFQFLLICKYVLFLIFWSGAHNSAPCKCLFV